MRKLPFLLLPLICVAFAWSDDTVVEEIIARVNDSIVTRSEFQHSKEQLVQEIRQQVQNPTEAEKELTERDKDVLRDLIDQQLLIQKGKDLGINGDTELIKKLDDLRKQMGLSSLEDLEKAAQQQGVSYEDFKQNMRNSIITQSVISKEVGSHIQMTKDEEQKFYDEHKQDFERPEQIRLSEILVSTPAAPSSKEGTAAEVDPQVLEAAEAKAKQVLESIRKGSSFEEVAKKNSEGPTAAQGGDLGYFKRGVLAKELEEKTFAMKAGEVSEPVRTKQGYVILKVTEHQQAGLPALKDVENQIQEGLYYKKLQPSLRAYLTKLREEAFIDIKQGYVDTAASPNETKPVFTTASADTEKARKKRKRFLVF